MPTQLLSHSLSWWGQEEKIRWKSSWAEVNTGRLLTNNCYEKNRNNSLIINLLPYKNRVELWETKTKWKTSPPSLPTTTPFFQAQLLESSFLHVLPCCQRGGQSITAPLFLLLPPILSLCQPGDTPMWHSPSRTTAAWVLSLEYNLQENIAPAWVPHPRLQLLPGACSHVGSLSILQGTAVFWRGRSSIGCRRTTCIIMVFLDCRESDLALEAPLPPAFLACAALVLSHFLFSFSQSCCTAPLTFPKYTFLEEPLLWLWGWAVPWAEASWNCVWCGAAPVLFSQRPPLQPSSCQNLGITPTALLQCSLS